MPARGRVIKVKECVYAISLFFIIIITIILIFWFFLFMILLGIEDKRCGSSTHTSVYKKECKPILSNVFFHMF